MIEIIKKGDEAPKKRAECQHCGCVFDYQKDDVQTIFAGSYKKIVRCPQCDRILHMPEWDDMEVIDD